MIIKITISKFRRILILLICFTWSTACLSNSEEHNYEILAHRGLHQTFSPIGVTNSTCTASRIYEPTHEYIENTIKSIKAAIELGADIVEFDIHPTTDGEFVVFHDWELSCRTNGKGVVREHDLKYLKSLDVGYGYTSDHGKTFPFRGAYVGAMPTLNEVLDAFPNKQFLINIKSRSIDEAKQLTIYLKQRENEYRRRLYVYGSGEGVEYFAEQNPDILTLSKSKAKSCLMSYVLIGWSGYVPKSCHRSLVPVPENYQWLIWGWPEKFENRLKQVNSRSILMGKHEDGKANSGIDSLESLSRIPKDYRGLVFTNRIDLLGSRKKSNSSN